MPIRTCETVVNISFLERNIGTITNFAIYVYSFLIIFITVLIFIQIISKAKIVPTWLNEIIFWLLILGLAINIPFSIWLGRRELIGTNIFTRFKEGFLNGLRGLYYFLIGIIVMSLAAGVVMLNKKKKPKLGGVLLLIFATWIAVYFFLYFRFEIHDRIETEFASFIRCVEERGLKWKNARLFTQNPADR